MGVGMHSIVTMGILCSEWISVAYIFMHQKPMDKEEERIFCAYHTGATIQTAGVVGSVDFFLLKWKCLVAFGFKVKSMVFLASSKFISTSFSTANLMRYNKQASYLQPSCQPHGPPWLTT